MRMIGCVAVVTGAGRGIGRRVALGFAREGADLVLASRTRDELEAVAVEAQALGRRALVCPADVRDAAAIQSVVDAALAEWGRIDVLFNAAGIPMVAPSETLALEDWERTMSVNVTGTFICCQLVGRVMLAQGRGSIINIGSLTSYVGFPLRTAYAASKTAILGLTRSLAVEWAERGVRVNAIAPGWIRTEIQDALVAQGKLRRDPIIARTPMRRVGEVNDMVGPAVFLASEESAFMTGETLAVDGGWLAYGYI